MKTKEFKEKEEEKKYYLKHKWAGAFLNKDVEDNHYFWAGDTDSSMFKTKFTLTEIEEIKKTYNTSLEDFKMIEVEE